MIFSRRTQWDLADNDLTTAARHARAAGTDLVDLTVSNPTACDFTYPEDLLSPLASASALQYSPEPFGLLTAREAVAGYYADHHATVTTDAICLTTSTTEAYSFLFRLLCDPGDEVLIARPGYPLFDFIAQLDSVVLREYPLHYDPNASLSGADGGWSIDLDALTAAITPRTRAIIVVHPNNPTGSVTTPADQAALLELCTSHHLALIVDEVFLDYPFAPAAIATFATLQPPCLTFVLSGISKVCALPQMKASWIATLGPSAQTAPALARLEVIADTYLSMNAPIQTALPLWITTRHRVQQQIRARMAQNLATLDRRIANTSATRLALHAGWTTILRVPRTVPQGTGDPVEFAHAALATGVLVQPGSFYDLPAGRAILSLLTPPKRWERGLNRLPI